MKNYNILKFVSALMMCIFCIAINAQNVSIIDDLEQDKPSQGKIRIKSDSHITALVSKGNSGNNISGDTQYLKMPGYRINVFSGNTRQSKDEAFSKEKQIKDLFSELATYVTYDSPLWRLRVGNFESSEEATLFMQNLKTELPSLGKEMYVVPDEIRVPLNN